MQGVYIVFAAICVLAGCSGPTDQSTAPASSPAPALDTGEVNLDVWLERLEVGSRELYSAREAVVAAVRISEGDVVADIGAGTGLYTLLFADAVGPTGLVFAEDIEPLFLDLINRRVDDLGFDNVTSVLGRNNHISLPKESVDIVFIADTYHYFNDREEVMRSVYAALKPGGALIIIDYNIAPGEQRPEHKSHVLFGKAGVISEMEFIGFEIVGEISVEGLDDNYFLRFLKP
ncbi:MAG: class I SAM-dependent methyltransferase [Marinicaulis sp.]|nr:class I SAM-dependent methyltransferase [Marinicaulis sp.]